MFKNLPQLKRRSAPWTPLQRRTWLANERRKHRLLPAPVLRVDSSSLLQWDWFLPNPFRWQVWMSLDGGTSFILVADYWADGAARQFAPDGGSEWYYLVGVDATGREITRPSNVVRPDDAPVPGALLDGLMGYWPLDGDLFDVSGNGNDGQDAGLTAFSPGKIGSGAESHNTSQISTGLPLPLAFSLSCWVKSAAGGPPGGWIFCAHAGGEDTGSLAGVTADAGGAVPAKFAVDIYAIAGWSPTLHGAVPASVFDWNQVVLTCDEGATYRLYLNNQLVDTFNGLPLTTAEPLMLFGAGTGYIEGYNFTGALDEIGLWQRALSAAEIAQLYNQGDGLAYDWF